MIGQLCYEYREKDLNLTRSKFSELTGVPYKTIASFEMGLSSNLYIVYLYIKHSDDDLKGVLLDRIDRKIGDISEHSSKKTEGF